MTAPRLAYILPVIALAGCAHLSWENNARYVLSTAAKAGAQADERVHDGYVKAAKEANARHGIDEESEYQAAMRPWNDAVGALEVYRAALLAAQALLDSGLDLEDLAFESSAACFVAALQGVNNALLNVGLRPPKVFADILDISEMLLGMCDGEPR